MTSSAAPFSYRADIDGLRAIAVLAVVAFHAEIGLFHGGFAGVDIFFVVSGYLISGIILASLEKGSFSFAEFYTRRINRIFPALALVLVVCLVVGWIVLFPPEFVSLGKHTAGGSGFIANFLLWGETGYFDSRDKPLLHLWSLAVEEQFYLIWPVLLVLFSVKRWKIGVALVLLAGFSFALNILAVSASRGNLAFYWPVTRLWELLAGAALIWSERTFQTRRRSSLVSGLATLVGVCMIGGAVFLVSANAAWPGWLALIPVIATVLIIGPGRDSWINRAVLSHRWLVGIGLISYPLYLWHWPTLLFGRLINEGQLTRVGRISLVVVSIILAWLTYRFVEKPIRFGLHKRRSARALTAGLVAICALGFAVFTETIPSRLAAQYEAVVRPKSDKFPPDARFTLIGDDIVVPMLGGDTTSTIALLGDSHASQYWPRFQALVEGHPFMPRMLLLSKGYCPPIPKLDRKGRSAEGARFQCSLFHEKALERLQDPNVRTVVYSAYWEAINDGVLYFSDDPTETPIDVSDRATDSAFALLENEIRGLRTEGKSVVIILSNPNSFANHPKALLPRRLPGLPEKPVVKAVDRKEMDSRSEKSRSRLSAIAIRTGAVVIDPMSFFCNATACRTTTEDGQAIYADDLHCRLLVDDRHSRPIEVFHAAIRTVHDRVVRGYTDLSCQTVVRPVPVI